MQKVSLVIIDDKIVEMNTVDFAISEKLSTVSYVDFVKFVENIPSERLNMNIINHDMSWNHCAMGLFIKQYLGDVNITDITADVFDHMGFPYGLANGLGYSHFDTYGDLQRAIASYDYTNKF